jgi:exopolyphosphatase / guanosine-5'-triphosphate,3'-diphosphate pyrophosphatase
MVDALGVHTLLLTCRHPAQAQAHPMSVRCAGGDDAAMGSDPSTLASAASGARAIVPRWEWRIFAPIPDSATARLAGLETARVEDSDETYLLSLTSDASAKIRGGRMDVKRLERVDGDGLELWMPVMKAAFPLPVAEVRSMLAVLEAAPPALARAEYTFEQLLAEVVDPSSGLLGVGVHKRREHYTLDGCMAELTEMRTATRAARTIAVESEDPAQVLAAVHELGAGARPVVCVAKGLKALVGFGARRYAVIDVGTNSVKFHVAERTAAGDLRTIADRAEVTRLGEGLDDTGRLGREPIERTVEAIAGMVDEARASGTSAIAAVGTAGLRIAPNAADLVDAVQARTGVRVEVIPGDEEARLAYVAARAGLEPGVAAGATVVFDSGGGSSQFTFGRGDRVDERFSVNVGAVRVTERYGLDGVTGPEALAAARAGIAADLAALAGRPRPDAIVGMGGAVTNLAAVKHALDPYDPDVVRGTVLDRVEIDRQIALYAARTAGERRAIVGLQPNRAEVILAGACIVRTVLDLLGRDELTVSDRGLRHGLLAERLRP